MRLLPMGDARFRVARARSSVCVLVGFVPVLGLAAAQGGYFPTAWGWASVPLLWTAALALIVRSQLRLSTFERIFLAAMVALTCWIALSTLWSAAPAESVLETERALVYVAGLAAVLLVSRTHFVRHILGGIVVAISLIAAFSLATRLLPDRIGVYDPTAGYRLAQPIGYWNGLALFAAMGALLALTFAARARTTTARAASAAALVLLLPTFYFTFGRGAWIALACGLVAAAIVDPRRLQLLATTIVVGPAPAVATWIGSRKHGLTHTGTSLVRAAHDGHRVALALFLLAAVNAGAAAALALAERHVAIGYFGRRVFGTLIAVILALALATVFMRYGGPVTLVQKGYAAFKAPPPHISGNLNRRLLSFSGNGRADLWRLAGDDASRHPLLGTGAGTYERYFLAHQPPNVGRVRDAHGLYIETLAELGPLGLTLLVALLAVPLTAAWAVRAHPLVPGALGAYTAYLIHAAADWDWELPAVTLVGLLCGASILIAHRRFVHPRSLSPPQRWIAVGALVAAATVAAVGLAGNAALSRSESAREAGDWARAAADAERARSWMPWSPEPWVALGRAQLGANLRRDARESFRKAISIDARDWQIWYDLASASAGRAQRSALEHATALFPRSGLVANRARTRSDAP